MKNILDEGVKKLGITLPEGCCDSLILYSELLKEWNEKINLTAITDDEGIATKHFLDSLTAIKTGYVKGKVIDVGTGAGFPGIVLKMAEPQISLTLLDSLNKRINFLKEVCEKTKLDGVEFIHARAEDGGHMQKLRKSFDTVTARAVANMTVLCELCLPFLKVGGYFLALKGPMANEELNDAKRTISVLGGDVEGIFECEIPFTELSHKIIIIKKVKKTPMKYPRKPGLITKSPVKGCYNSSQKRRN